VKPAPWILLFAAVGFGISALFSGELRLARDLLVLVYLVGVGGVLIGFLRRHQDTFARHLRRQWAVGLLAGLIVGTFLASTVARQPGSPPPKGVYLVWSLAWLGLIYGLVDALLLNVLPVMVLEHASTTSTRLGRMRFAAIAFAASMLVSGAYHLGYREFRGAQLVQPLIGNAVMTASYLLTGNAAAPLLSHVIMHGAAVLHGVNTTVQLPPHYPDARRVTERMPEGP
jgi:hypothetical protein